MKRTLTAAAFAIAALLLVACTSGDQTGTVASSTTTTATPTTSSAPTTTTTSTTTTTTVSTTTSTTVPEPAPPGLTPAVPGHNDLDADRINLVFGPWGWDGTDADDYAAILTMHLGWDGTAQLIDLDGRPATTATAASADLGLFGWEPFRSNRDRFNLWLTDATPGTPVGWLNGLEPEPTDLPNAVHISMALDVGRALDNTVSLAGHDIDLTWPDPQRTSDDPFANVMIAIDSAQPAATLRVLPHELGHAMFLLPDEYVGRLFGYTGDRNSFYPSCPADLATAEAWWGDRIGETDPMVDVWAAELTAAGFPPDELEVEFARDDTTLAFVEGGCFEVPGSYRMTVDSIMGFGAPGFGIANTEAGQTILDLFSGT